MLPVNVFGCRSIFQERIICFNSNGYQIFQSHLKFEFLVSAFLPGSTLHGYLSKILTRSCQDLRKILAKILPRYWQELQDVMVRSYQESHVPKKTFIVKSYLERKNLKGSQQKSAFLQIYIVRH